MDIEAKVIHAFKDIGYTNAKMNVWNNVRLYVNLNPERSFSYDMTQGFKISSRIKLTPEEFRTARNLIPLLKRHRDQLMDGASI